MRCSKGSIRILHGTSTLRQSAGGFDEGSSLAPPRRHAGARPDCAGPLPGRHTATTAWTIGPGLVRLKTTGPPGAKGGRDLGARWKRVFTTREALEGGGRAPASGPDESGGGTPAASACLSRNSR